MSGDVVRAIRLHFDLSQSQFAQALGVSQTSVWMMETGRRPISTNMRTKIAQVFELTDELMEAIRRAKLINKLD